MPMPLLMMAAGAAAEGGEKQDTASYLLNHVQDSHEWALPGSSGLAHAYDIHDWLGHWNVTIAGHEIDLTPTRFALIMMLAAVLLMGTLLWSMRGRGQSPKGRLQTLVEDLMSLSRIEAEKHEFPRERIDLGQMAQTIASEVGFTVGDERIVPETEHGVVCGDRQQLDQLIRNLIDNALKYGDADAPVTVRVRRERGDVVLEVADRGEGIHPDHLPYLTRRFYRSDPGRSRAAGGTGLGLAIVKHIVERHRGKLDIASTLGQGSTVTVHLPLVEPETTKQD